MVYLACASSRCANPDRAAADVAAQIESQLGSAKAKAAVFFATTAYGPGFGQFERALRAAAGTDQVVGCSASGVLSRDGEVEHGTGVSALVFAGDIEARRVFVSSLRGRAEEVGRELGRAARDLEREPRTLLVLADTYNLAPDELIAGAASAAPGVAIVGAGATEDGSVGESTVVARGAASANAVASLAIGGVRVRTVVNPSCVPYGAWRTITRAEGNRILEIEHRPALETYLAALPSVLRDDLPQALRITFAALAEPTDGEEIPPPHVVRPFLGADPRAGALLAGDEVLPGTRFAIAVRDGRHAREALDANLARFVASGPSLAGALYFDALDRGEALYGVPGIETAYLRRRLGDVPLAGFFCGAGLAPLAGRNRFHQYAGVLVGLEAA